MKPKHLFFVISLFFLLSLALVPASFASTNAEPWDERNAEMNAQHEVDHDERSAQEEMGSSIYGRITSIDRNAKTLNLLATDQVEDVEDEEDDDDFPENYHFTSNTSVAGIGSVNVLREGDFVTLEYYTYHDRNKITEISFDKHGEGQGNGPEMKATALGDLYDDGSKRNTASPEKGALGVLSDGGPQNNTAIGETGALGVLSD